MGMPTTTNNKLNITADSEHIAIISGSNLPNRAMPIEPLAHCSHSADVASRSSEPIANMVPVVVKISSIIGRNTGSR